MSIVATKDGPYAIKGVSTYKHGDTQVQVKGASVALCRCGGTKSQVGACDGTHFKEFKDASSIPEGVTPEIITVIPGGPLKVQQPGDAPDVYLCRCGKSNNKPLCDGSHMKKDKQEEAAAQPAASASAMKATKNGPYIVKGAKAINFLGKDTLSPGTKALCRCGATNSRPYCDGSHASVGFADDHEIEFPEGFQPEVYTVIPNGPIKVTSADGQVIHLCRCGQSKSKPRCDGSHKTNFAPDKETTDMEDLLKPQDKKKRGDTTLPPSTEEEPTLQYIKTLGRDGLLGHHGPMGAMGVRHNLPSWADLQIMVSQVARKPLLDDAPVDSRVVIGPRARKPVTLELPIFVSDMSFGALSASAKICLAKGAEMAGTGICSGEGGMLPEEQQANSRYFLEYASGEFGWDLAKVASVQAFHFKGGQGAKTGTGGHLPGAKVTPKIAAVRGLKVGQDAISPSTFINLHTAQDFHGFADRVREASGGIPIGFKLSANHIEEDIQFALDASADYIILDGRGGATGAAPLIFRDNISVPTIPALARARAYLDSVGADDVSLIITGGLRTPDDFVKALALGADAVAIANSAIQSIGCVAARQCNSNTCPAGIATQNPDLEALLDVEKGAKQLCNFLEASRDLIKVMARACSHSSVSEFNEDDLSTWKLEMAELSGVRYAGVGRKKHKKKKKKDKKEK